MQAMVKINVLSQPSEVDTEANVRAFRDVEGMLDHRHIHQDNKQLTDTLRSRFATAESMFSAGAYSLERLGMHPHDALLISQIPALARYVAHTRYGNHPQVGRLPLAAAYLRTNFIGLQVEEFYLLCIDVRGRLMENVFLNRGIEDSALFDLHQVLANVMRISPNAVVISHNHPGRTMRPSQDDIECTYDMIEALSTVGIPLLDHVLIAGNEAVSLRENGFIPASVWIDQKPENKLLINWLSDKNMPKSSEAPPAESHFVYENMSSVHRDK